MPHLQPYRKTEDKNKNPWKKKKQKKAYFKFTVELLNLLNLKKMKKLLKRLDSELKNWLVKKKKKPQSNEFLI